MSEKSVTCNCTNLLHQIEGDKEDILQEHTLRHQNQICGGKIPPPPPIGEWILSESWASKNIQARKWNGWNVVIIIYIFLNTQKQIQRTKFAMMVIWISHFSYGNSLTTKTLSFVWKKTLWPPKVYIQNAKTVAVKCRKCLAERKISRRGGEKVPAPNHTTFTSPDFITRTLSSTIFPLDKIHGKIRYSLVLLLKKL